MNEYPLPDNVTSPRSSWHLIKVLHRGDPADPAIHVPTNYSIAVGMWDEEPWDAHQAQPPPEFHQQQPSAPGMWDEESWDAQQQQQQQPVITREDEPRNDVYF